MFASNVTLALGHKPAQQNTTNCSQIVKVTIVIQEQNMFHNQTSAVLNVKVLNMWFLIKILYDGYYNVIMQIF